MSRSGYSDDCDGWALIRWRGAVASAIKGKRGQAFLRELLDALDAMSVKELITGELERDGSYCALGLMGMWSGVDLKKAAYWHDWSYLAKGLGISEALTREIYFHNDEGSPFANESPSQTWTRMRRWTAENIK